MTIAVIGKFYTEGFGLHIDEALQDMGHETVLIDPEVDFDQLKFLGNRIKNINKTLYQEIFGKLPAIRNVKSKKIYKSLKRKNVDLTIVLHDFLTNYEVKEVKAITKSPVVLWFPDAISNFQKAMFFVAGYDTLFFSDKYIVSKLKNEFDLNTYYLPQCFNINRHKKVELSEQDKLFYSCDITNAGNFYPSRAALYKHLVEYNVKMWGYPLAIWLKVPELESMTMNKVVYNEEKSKAFSAAKIVLNNLHPAVIDGVNKRTFEIPACGGFQIISYRKAVEDLFQLDSEIVCYKDLSDLKEKINYYLDSNNEKERLEIVRKSQLRAIKEHTYQHRLQELINQAFKN